MKITVLNILWGYYPGGVTTYYKQLCKIKKSRISFFNVVLIRKSMNIDITVEDNVNIILYDSLFHLSWVKELLRIIKKEKVDVIFNHAFNGAISSIPIYFMLRKKKKFLFSYHGDYLAPTKSKYLIGLFYNWLVVRVYRYFKCRLICVSKYSKNNLISKKVSENKIDVIHNGIDNLGNIEKINNTGKNLKCLMVCRVDPYKGVDIAAKAFSNTSHLLTIVGDGPLLNDLKIKHKSDTNIQFIGRRENIRDYLDSHEVFLSASFVENHSISILEAMRQRKIIICTDVGGNTESVRNNIDGIVIQPHSTEAIVEALNYVVDNKSKSLDMANSARSRYEDLFTTEVFRENILHVVESL